MILHYFKNKENIDKDNISSIYDRIIDSIKIISLNNNILTEKNFNLSFELTSILLFSIFSNKQLNIKGDIKGDIKEKKQYLMDLFISDIDHSLRLSGIGDMSIGKYVKSYVKKFYYRISKLDLIFSSPDTNFDKFHKYLLEFDIIQKSEDKTFTIRFYKDLQILIERSKDNQMTCSIFDELFK